VFQRLSAAAKTFKTTATTFSNILQPPGTYATTATTSINLLLPPGTSGTTATATSDIQLPPETSATTAKTSIWNDGGHFQRPSAAAGDVWDTRDHF